MRRLLPLSACALLIGLLPAASFAALIGSFEQNTDGWIDWASQANVSGVTQGGAGVGAGVTTLPSQYTYSATGATVGSSSLALLLKAADSPEGNGYYQALSDKLEYNTDSTGGSEVTDFLNGNTFSIDVTFNSANFIGASYANIQLIVNAQGFQDFGSPINPTSDTGNPGNPGGWDPTDFKGITTRTISWNYSSILPSIAANPGYVELILKTSTDALAGTMYFDNAQLVTVPEPASLGLLAVGALGLLRRRRVA